MNHDIEDNKPWYQQFWPWFLIALPAITVLAGIATLSIAIMSPNATVVDDYAKIGFSIKQNHTRDERAKQLGLSAAIAFDQAKQQVTIILESQIKNSMEPTQNTQKPKQLTLYLSHPTLQSHDQTIKLMHQDDHYVSAAHSVNLNSRWDIELQPKDQSWRLSGTLAALQNTLLLQAKP